MKKHIPNFLTSLNAFSGCVATVMAFHGEYGLVVVWVIVAAIFDFSDGFAARLLKAYSNMGKELDSLADAISFGLAPGATLFMFLSQNVTSISQNEIVCTYLPYSAFLITVFSVLRLAKFNVDTRQSESFIGLNTPANALFWVSFCFGLTSTNHLSLSSGMIYTVLVGIVAFSFLLVSELPMFSLKIKSVKLRGNELRYFLAVTMIGFIAFFGFLGISAGILLYIGLSILNNNLKAQKKK